MIGKLRTVLGDGVELLGPTIIVGSLAMGFAIDFDKDRTLAILMWFSLVIGLIFILACFFDHSVPPPTQEEIDFDESF